MDSILSCLPWLGRIWRARDQDPERQPLFPPPDTVLTPPRRRPELPPIHAGIQSAPISPTQPFGPLGGAGAVHAHPQLGLSHRERIGSISRAYQGRMLPLNRTSQPPTPSTAYTFFRSRQSSTSLTAMPIPDPQPQSRTHPSSPARPLYPTAASQEPALGVPVLGRSISDPGALSLLAQTERALFADHQSPSGTPGGGIRGRPRSATALDRLSALTISSEVSPDRSKADNEKRSRSDSPRKGEKGEWPSTSHVRGHSVTFVNDEELSGEEVLQEDEEQSLVAETEAEMTITRVEMGLRELGNRGSRTRRGKHRGGKRSTG